MKTTEHRTTIKAIVQGFEDKGDEGVTGLSGKLDIRPAYQREFVYDDKKRNAVISTVLLQRPLGFLYFSDNKDGTYELMDGQQRVISICRYVTNDFAVDHRFFQNMTKGEQDDFLNYKLLVVRCEGTEKEKLDWFSTINTGCAVLTDQEIRNAAYIGEWLASAKKLFSKPKCSAEGVAKDYVRGTALRQDYLETALTWISKGNVEQYMAEHQKDPNANKLWTYFKNVLDWVKLTFPNYRKEMKGVDWGPLYDAFHKETLDSASLERQINKLFMDEDVTKHSGIWPYVLTGNPKHLSLRAFNNVQKMKAFAKAKGICAKCGETFTIDQVEADHITPWSKGGKTVPSNCQILCKNCNRTKSDK